MLKDFTGTENIYIVTGYTDIRKGIDGLSILLRAEYHLDPLDRSLYLFCGRRSDRIKGLYWEKDGFVLIYKRLEDGRFRWPRSKEEAKKITPQQFRWLMEGLSIDQPHANRELKGLKVL